MERNNTNYFATQLDFILREHIILGKSRDILLTVCARYVCYLVSEYFVGFEWIIAIDRLFNAGR